MDNENLFNKTEQELIGIAVNQLSSVCDMAAKKDGVGFNKPDARKGHHLASLPLDEWTELDYAFCWAILFKYQTQLEAVFKISISELYKEKLKGVKKEDIPKILTDVREKLRDRITDDHLMLFTEEAFIFVYNDKNYSSNVDAAFKFLNAEKVEGETNTKWIIKNKYIKGLEYIVNKLIGVTEIHFSKGSYGRMIKGFNDEITLTNLLSSGFDERDVISLIDLQENEPVHIEIKARNTYKEARKLTNYKYIKEENRAVARIAFEADYKIISTLINALKFKLKIKQEHVTIRQFMQVAQPNMLSPEYYQKEVSGVTVTIADHHGYLNLAKSPVRGTSLARDGYYYKFTVYGEKGLRGLISFMQGINSPLSRQDIINIKDNLNNNDTTENDRKGAIKSLTDTKKKQDEKTLRRENEYVFVKFPYSKQMVDLIKGNIDPHNRKYIPSSQEWQIKDDLLSSEFVQNLQKDHGFHWI